MPSCREAERRWYTEKSAKHKLGSIKGGRRIEIYKVSFPEVGKDGRWGPCREQSVDGSNDKEGLGGGFVSASRRRFRKRIEWGRWHSEAECFSRIEREMRERER